jgi:hypothetical protein
MHKLRYYGIDGKTTRWIKNWLEDRQQTVVLNGVSSEAVSVDSGVPQGSVLGPGLFLFYINDLQSKLTSKVRLFADDTIIYLTIANEDDASTLHFRNPCCSKYKMLFSSACCMMFLAMICSRILQQTDVSEIGQ